MEKDRIIVTGSPHVATRRTTRSVMWQVVASLVPALLVSLIFFGWRAWLVVGVSVIGCWTAEYVCGRWMMGRRCTLGDGSATLTGVLLGMCLPSSLPLGMAFVGGLFAVGVGKMAFGGLGQNIFNPALVGRVFLLISFPVAMTTWPLPTMPDGTTGATILSTINEGEFGASTIDYFNQALGNRGGSLGEVGAFALLLGGAYLLIRRIIKIWTPLTILASMAILAAATGSNVAVELLSGGVLLGAIFMATDYVTSPMTAWGQVIYGTLIGVITFVIRHYGAYPEGISFAILIMNGCTPLINRWTRPRLFGERRAAA